MSDLFNYLHSNELGVLPVFPHEPLPVANVSGNDIKDPPPSPK